MTPPVGHVKPACGCRSCSPPPPTYETMAGGFQQERDQARRQLHELARLARAVLPYARAARTAGRAEPTVVTELERLLTQVEQERLR